MGGWDILQWTDPTIISSAALAGVLPLIGVTDFVIALGNNNPANQTPAQFTASLVQVVNRLRAAVPSASITFLPTYDTDTTGTGTSHLVGFTDGHYAAQRQVPNSCFLNLYTAAGPWTQLNAAGYLSDGVHPSAAGVPYFVQTVSAADPTDLFGVTNVVHWSGQDTNATLADTARLQRSLDSADAAIDDYFRGGPYAVPLVPGGSAPTLRRWAATLAGAWLFRSMSSTSGSSASASLSLPAGAAFSASVNSSTDPHTALLTDVYAEMAACKAGAISLDCAPAAVTLATAPAVSHWPS